MSAIIMPEFFLTLAEVASIAVDRDRPEDLPLSDVKVLKDAYSSMHQNFREARVVFEEKLGRGLDAARLKGLHEKVSPLRLQEKRLTSIVARWEEHHENSAPDFVRPLIAEVKGLLAETSAILALLEVVSDALAQPATPLDPEKARAAREAYARGETKPFAKGSLTGQE
jgi:hypothetical protein